MTVVAFVDNEQATLEIEAALAAWLAHVGVPMSRQWP